MTAKEIRKYLESLRIDTSIFPDYYQDYYRNHKMKDCTYSENVSLDISLAQLKSVIKACNQFREFYDQTEFSKLVCKKIVTFSRLHCLYLSSKSQYPELFVGTYATPTHLPTHLEVSCSKCGLIKRSTKLGYPPMLINF